MALPLLKYAIEVHGNRKSGFLSFLEPKQAVGGNLPRSTSFFLRKLPEEVLVSYYIVLS